MLTQIRLPYSGEFSLAAAIGFLEGWPPSAPQAQSNAELHWAFHAGSQWNLIDATVTQDGPAVTASIRTDGDVDQAGRHVSRILGLDVDARRFTPENIDDPVASPLIADRPGLRPTSFWSPYEAAVWAVLSQRVSMVQASRLKLRVAQQHGTECGGFWAFPAPATLLGIGRLDGVNDVKMSRLHAVAQAALDGVLDPESIRAEPTEDAIEQLRSIPGIGPFSAELILVRGAGHPDVFPAAEQRLHRIMRERYARPEASTDELAEIAAAWRPYRSWVSFLFRSSVG